MKRKARQGQRESNAVEIAGGGHAMRSMKAGEQRTHSRDGLKRGLESLAYARLQIRQEPFWQYSPLRTVVLQHHCGAAPQKQLQRLLDLELDAVPCEDF